MNDVNYLKHEVRLHSLSSTKILEPRIEVATEILH